MSGGTLSLRAMQCMTLDGPDALALNTLESPPPGPGEVRLRLGASGVNFPDLLMTRGLYQHKAEPPFIPGLEAAGTVVDVGEGVTGWTPGDRAVAMTAAAGAGFAELTTVAADLLLPVPEGMSDVDAACLYVGHSTAWNGVVDRGRLQPGETLVVTGAAGGVGLAAVQLGRAMGAQVIAVASSETKRAVTLEEGAHHALDPADPDLRDKVKALTGGVGADVVYDPVGGRMFTEGVRMLRPEGRLAIIGFAGGEIAQFGSNIVLIKEIELIGVRAGQYGRRHPDRRLAAWKRMSAWVAEGTFRPRVSRTFPLAEGAAALKALEDRSVIGKVAVTMD
ncbi:MAG: NADPH:quinone oxidoreductase [Rhodobacteraceae bacterium]|nr:NADPH:quinone oxidoreductase [Paracoccaceae bacterium]MBR25612.1 NADPH:quinone oxidoreductase [Paracoccaceae bacterium]MBR29622.1 NADPH:quinone oxidoreductase [Paracoccaceae bacterium]